MSAESHIVRLADFSRGPAGLRRRGASGHDSGLTTAAGADADLAAGL